MTNWKLRRSLFLLFLLLCPSRCQREVILDVAWWHYPPYIKENGTSVDGLFKHAAETILVRCQQRLRDEHNITLKDKYDQVANPRDCLSLLSGGTKAGHVQVCLPFTRSREHVMSSDEQQEIRQTKTLFIPLLESPGAVHFYIKSLKPVGNDLVVVIAQGWPMLVLILLGAAYSGIIIWLLDRLWNPENFPKPFLRGFWEGFWWAFVTMTTVGYGDTTPRSLQARLFGLVWIVVGVAILSVFTATVTTILTQESLGRKLEIQGVNMLVINGSKEYEIAVSKGTRPMAVSTFEEILTTLKRHKYNDDSLVENALQDQYSFAAQQDQLDPDDMLIDRLYSYPMEHGALLNSGQEPLVGQCLYEEAAFGRSVIVERMTEFIKPLKTRTTSALESARSLFQPQTVLYMGYAGAGWLGLFIIFILWEFVYWRPKHRRSQEMKRKQERSVATIMKPTKYRHRYAYHPGRHYICPCNYCKKYNTETQTKEQNNVIKNELNIMAEDNLDHKSDKNLLQQKHHTTSTANKAEHIPGPSNSKSFVQSGLLSKHSIHARLFPEKWQENESGDSGRLSQLSTNTIDSLIRNQNEEILELEEEFNKYRQRWEDRLREVLDAHQKERARLMQSARDLPLRSASARVQQRPLSRKHRTDVPPARANLGYEHDDDVTLSHKL